MTRICHWMTDTVSGQPVYIYQDYYGKYWLAQSAWGSFRVEAAPTTQALARACAQKGNIHV